MSMRPRIEEVSDSDSDPSEMDPSDFDPSQSIISPANIPSTTQSAAATRQQEEAARAQQAAAMRAAREATKRYLCLYPIYFDSSRSRAEGRRVNKSDGVPNPLARSIIDALQTLSLPGGCVAFEPSKMHPKDWANPGRVRVQLRDEQGRDTTGGKVRNKLDLINKVAAYLKEHPTTDKTPLALRIPGVPTFEGDVPPVHIPRGVKMGNILPLHSPAMSGGGVSDNMFGDMMKEMQAAGAGGGAGNPLANMANMFGGMGGGMGGGMPALGGPQGSAGGQQKKKDKKGKR